MRRLGGGGLARGVGGLARGAPRRHAAPAAASRGLITSAVAGARESHKCVKMDALGVQRVGRLTVRQLREATGAPLRDLIQSSGPTCILPRDRAILIKLGSMKAVIAPDEALFFDADRLGVRRAVRRIGEGIVAALAPPNGGAVKSADVDVEDEDLPFELAVLEGVLRELCASYTRRCQLYEPVVDSTLGKISDHFDYDSDGSEGCDTPGRTPGIANARLHRLAAFDGALSNFDAEVTAAVGVLRDLLASDEDMLALLTSERQAAAGEQRSVDPARHEVVELLLESYHRRLTHVAHAVRTLRQRVASSRDLARVNIDLHRNRIIRFNLYLSMATVGLASATTLAGLFGMNLRTGLEDTPGAFAVACVVSVGLGAAICGLAHATLTHHARSDNRAQTAARDRQTLEGLLENLATIEQIFDNKIDTPLRRDDVARLIETATGRSTTSHEIDLVFEIFDPSGDDVIDAHEARSALTSIKLLKPDPPKGTPPTPKK